MTFYRHLTWRVLSNAPDGVFMQFGDLEFLMDLQLPNAFVLIHYELSSGFWMILAPLPFSVLHCIALHCIALHCIALHCIALHCIALHCLALHCIALPCIALQYAAAVQCFQYTFLASFSVLPPGFAGLLLRLFRPSSIPFSL